MKLFKNLDSIPRSEIETLVSSLEGDALELFAYGDRVEQLGKAIKDRFQQVAIAEAESLSSIHGNTFTVGNDKVSIRRTKNWLFMDDVVEEIEGKIAPLDKDLKSLKSSLKARQTYLIEVGEGVLESESVTISLAKK
jgi:hypothetical protein